MISTASLYLPAKLKSALQVKLAHSSMSIKYEEVGMKETMAHKLARLQRKWWLGKATMREIQWVRHHEATPLMRTK